MNILHSLFLKNCQNISAKYFGNINPINFWKYFFLINILNNKRGIPLGLFWKYLNYYIFPKVFLSGYEITKYFQTLVYFEDFEIYFSKYFVISLKYYCAARVNVPSVEFFYSTKSVTEIWNFSDIFWSQKNSINRTCAFQKGSSTENQLLGTHNKLIIFIMGGLRNL